MQTPDGAGKVRNWLKKAHRKIAWDKFGAWFATTVISVCALLVSMYGCSAENSARKLNNEQAQQIAELQKTTPTGQIARLVPYHPSRGLATITRVRHNPLVLEQIYNLYGRASDIPDNGDLYIVVHNYGERTSTFNETHSRFYLTQVDLMFGASPVDQSWEAPGVYIGGESASSSVASYRLSLYFCDSVDSEKISEALRNQADRNAGLLSLPYPSCRQLDTIFVRRGKRQ
jgi:hypothetical protein